MRADVFQSFPRRKFRQSASDPPRTDADCRGINLVRRVRGGFRVGNFYSAKNKICRIPRRRQSDPLAPIRTQADSIGVRRGIVPPPRLPQARTSRKVRGGHSRTLRVADAGGRFSVFSAAEVPPIRLGSAQDRRGLPRNKISPPSPRRIPRRKFLFRQK